LLRMISLLKGIWMLDCAMTYHSSQGWMDNSDTS